jgi:SAM-dependent methyltransferase
MKNSILNQVNKLYQAEHPSFYSKITSKTLKKIKKAREELLLKLKIPKKMFKNSTLLDLGSGSGIYSLVYKNLGAITDLVEYEKKFADQSRVLFEKFSINKKYKIYNCDIFKFKAKKKYDIIVFNGVAHHTQNPNKILDKACKLLKSGGFIIYGIGNKSGFFQRNLQRLILFKVSKSQNELIKNAKIFFQDHLKRAVKFGGRTKNQIIYDTYLNPKIDCQSSLDIINIYKNNKINLYSSFPNLDFPENILNKEINNYRNFNLNNKETKVKNKIFFSEHRWLSDNFEQKKYKIKQAILNLENLKDKIVTKVNDKSPINFNLNYLELIDFVDNYKNQINKLNSIKYIDELYQVNFFKEVKKLFILLAKDRSSTKDIKNYLSKTKLIFKGHVGVGMNYYVGYKN